jgi:hypothetical protein
VTGLIRMQPREVGGNTVQGRTQRRSAADFTRANLQEAGSVLGGLALRSQIAISNREGARSGVAALTTSRKM